MFCPNCRSIMFLKEELFHCRRCGFASSPDGQVTMAPTRVKEETAVVEEDVKTLPVAKVECPECQHREAFWVLKQTRASDEPETRIYTCTSCKHKWREY